MATRPRPRRGPRSGGRAPRQLLSRTTKTKETTAVERAGLFLPRPVFSHGQLYTAFSRSGYPPSAGKGVRVVVVEVEGAQGNLKGPDGGSSRATPYTARSSLAEGQARLHAQN